MKRPKPTAPTKPKDELNEFEAAALVGLSPRLLKWLASYAPKQGAERKLKVRKDGGRVFVNHDDLIEFNDWLNLPWPSKAGARPPIPLGILREVKEEAGGECAICLKNGNSCEAAHIDPVAKSKNNHPENLIWLCANHHTKFDHGGYGPQKEAKSFVKDFKSALTYYRRGLWQLQAQVAGRLYTMLKACDSLNKQLGAAKTPEQVAAVEGLATKAVRQVGKMAPSSKDDPDYAAFEAMQPQFKALAASSKTPKNFVATLKIASEVKAEFAQRAGYDACPLCKGTGEHKHQDCPACGGDGELTTRQISNLDLDRFTDVACPLCHGEGAFKGADCPACDGNGEMESRYAEQVDPRDWETVSCQLCKGSGVREGLHCPACGGNGSLDRRQRDEVDLRDFDSVKCPLCEGEGIFRGDDCPVCRGEGEMDRRFADEVDISQYESQDCPICKGSGEWHNVRCRACGGNGALDRRYADEIDRSDYKMVACPACRNRDVEFCRTCDGEGEVPRWVANEFD
ncbi:zinc finger domain-containing protein [Methylobacterium sp. E-045]|uniref:zinc finger domain-containing protein n=1 Tax=Methylobacterium sp. E-045 TaxID=2836575 RepID=UPI001FB9224A|nr:zinc finger domain-containing protein [Methylobacterium sp. E-045]MCJ2130977.1 hypothetical protein [Methylobacterium sp. E-045]